MAWFLSITVAGKDKKRGLKRMSTWLQEYLVTRVVNRCLKKIGEKPVKIRFVPADKQADIPNIAKSGDVHVIEAGCITKYYYYAEPGNPFLSEKYYSLADFVLDNVTDKARAKYVPAAFYLAQFPGKSRYPEVEAYLRNNKPVATRTDQLDAAMEIQKYLARMTFKKVDKVLDSYFSLIADRRMFGTTAKGKAESAVLLRGVWISHDLTREYAAGRYTVTSRNFNGETMTATEKYDVTNIINGMIVTLVQSAGAGLAREERLLISPDSKTLTIYDENGKHIYQAGP